LPQIKQLIGLTISLYITEKQPNLDYSQQSDDQILITDEVYQRLLAYYSFEISQTKEIADFRDIINKNPLFTSQMEPLQVALELFLKLCKVSFPDGLSNSRERTGGKRYPKRLHYTTNLQIIEICLRPSQSAFKNILFNWIYGKEVRAVNDEILNDFKSILTIFTEETQFRLRNDSNEEIIFQQEGIYRELLKGNEVSSDDVRENVGPFRVLKSFVDASLHPYLTDNHGFKPNTDAGRLSSYNGLVSNYLDVIPKRTVVTIEKTDEESVTITPSYDVISYNKILFGPPGTGKSHRVENIYAVGHLARRIVFHPDTDYAGFVGSYKPVSEDDQIQYKFVAQAFAKAYTDAWLKDKERHFLVIEEINRGNCAQIFGDLFQALDRNSRGFSRYDVEADTDLGQYLINFFTNHPTAGDRLGRELDGRGLPATAFGRVIIPNNLYLYATMNTSDQSLFPMDSAFKRRWDWEYVPIDYTLVKDFIVHISDQEQYSWADFIRVINENIYEVTQSEDKQLGNYFVVPADGHTITKDVFKDKVLFYLWTEVYKNEPDSQRIFNYWTNEPGQVNPVPFTFAQLYDTALEMQILKTFMEKALNLPNLILFPGA
jgi:hypothetical protein